MARQTKRPPAAPAKGTPKETATPAKATLQVDIEAVALWEPMGHKQGGASVAGLAIQSWDFRPPRDAERGSYVCKIVISQAPQEFRHDDGAVLVVRNGHEWTVEARYIETLEFKSADGPRPKHFFEAKISADLMERLRESPEDILARSDLFEVVPRSNR